MAQTLKAAIGLAYLDSNNLVAPGVCSNTSSASDNGVMFSAEFMCLLEANNEMTPDVAKAWLPVFTRCLPTPGLLQRTPQNERGQEGPDDYVGLAAACAVLLRQGVDCRIANDVLRYGLTHFGNFNNVTPWSFNRDSVMWRQLQLIAAFIAAASKPTWLSKAAYLIIGQPFYFVAAIVTLLSCRNMPTSDADSRRLQWLLLQTTAPASWMVRWAAKGWYERLYNDYEDGMKGVAATYYQQTPLHPFCTYFKDGYLGEEMP